MADFTIGDYDYTILSGTNVSVKVYNRTKTSYEDIPSTVTYGSTTYSVTDMSYCFYRCTSLTSAPSMPINVTNMSNCFYNCTSLTTAPSIPSSVTDMSYCFSDCTSLTSAPGIPASVINMRYCFRDCTSLTTSPNMSNATNVTNMSNCFYGCTSLISAPNIPGNVTNMYCCFSKCTSLTSAPSIPSSVTDISICFHDCTSLTTPPNMSNATGVIDMSSCFWNCTSLTTPPDMSNATNVTSMYYCFYGCTSLTSAPSIPSSVINIRYCFVDCINLTGVIEINSVTLTPPDDAFRNTTKLIVLKGTYPQLSTIANQYSNVYVYSLSDTITGERNDDILNLVTLSVQVSRFKAGSNDDVLSAINVYKNNNSSALLGLEWFTDDVADPQPDSTTWNQGEGWYLRDGNAPNYIFVEQNNEQLDTTKTYYKALESFIMNESPKIFYTNIDSISEDETTTFNIIVTDAYGAAATQYLTVPIAFYTMDVVKGGKVISFGQHATADMLYELLETEPADWNTNYNNYYEKDNFGDYISLTSASTFVADTYYYLKHPNGLFNCRMGIEATNAEFNGDIEATNAEFNGDIEATGTIIHKATGIDTETTPSSSQYTSFVDMRDINDVNAAYVGFNHHDTGTIETTLGAHRVINDEDKYNVIAIKIKENGDYDLDFSGNTNKDNIKTYTPTYNRCSAGSYNSFKRLGNMAFIHFNINVTTATAEYAYITGLPKALSRVACSSSGTSNANSKWSITTDGTLISDGAPATGWHNGCVSYLCQLD